MGPGDMELGQGHFPEGRGMPRVQGVCSRVWAAWGAGEVCGTGRSTSLGIRHIAVGRLGGAGVHPKGRGGLSRCVQVFVEVVGQQWASWDGGCTWGTRRVGAGQARYIIGGSRTWRGAGS